MQKVKIPHGVKGLQLTLCTKQHLQHRQQEGRTGSAGKVPPLLREKLLPGIIKGIEQPALLRRLGAQLLQLTPAQLQYLCALHPPAIQQRCKALHIVLPLQSLQKLLLSGEIVSRGPFLQPAQ